MKKKIFAWVLTVVMIAAMFAGCGSTGNNTGSTNTGSTGTTNTAGTTDTGTTDTGTTDTGSGNTASDKYSEEKPYHLTFAYIEFYQQDEAARQAVQDALNEYMIPTYHIEVEFLPLQYADYQTTIQLMLSGGDALDVMPIFYPYASSWISMGGVYDMNEFMSSADGQAIIAELGNDNAYVGQMNGVLYGFPANKESVELGGLCMRADICDALGITEDYGLEANKDEYDGTYYDWSVAADIFQRVLDAYPDMTPLYLSSTSQMARFEFFDVLVDQFGVLDWETDHKSTTVVNEFETDTYLKAVTMLADWYDKGYIYKDAMTDTQGSATVMKAGNTFSYATAIKPGFLVEAQAANGMDLYAMYFGNSEEGGISTTNVSFFNTGIASNSEDPEMAFKFVSALYSDATVMNLWQNGIEGVNYQVLDDGTAYFVDGQDSSNYTYHQNTGWFMGNQFISYVWNDGTKTADYWEKLSAHNNWAVTSGAFGFMWDSSEYSTQITALNNALETYRAALETGAIGSANVTDTLKKLNDALYAAGLQDVMDAKQAQLDEWLATQQ